MKWHIGISPLTLSVHLCMTAWRWIRQGPPSTGCFFVFWMVSVAPLLRQVRWRKSLNAPYTTVLTHCCCVHAGMLALVSKEFSNDLGKVLAVNEVMTGHLLTHPPTYALTHSLTHSLTHPPTHSLTHSPTHPPNHLTTHSLTHPPTTTAKKCAPLPGVKIRGKKFFLECQ